MEYGLIGNPLSHSYSKQIHESFNGCKYEITPLAPDELDLFFEKKDFKGINITIPYKETVIKYCKDISPLANKIGSINTIVKDKNGDLHGYNTDYKGFIYCTESAGIDFNNKNVIILGTGGTSKTAVLAVKNGNCKSVKTVSRTGEINYSNIYEKCADAQIIINTTPVGMFPHTNEQPVDLSKFNKAEAVIDVIYNPLNTFLLQQAKQLNLKYTNGLSMLISQAVYASDLFLSKQTEDNELNACINTIAGGFSSVCLVGMPGAGKTTLGKLLAEKLGKEFYDTDELIEKYENMSIPGIFSEKGEHYFRKAEEKVIEDITSKPGIIISVGGGAVLSEINRKNIRRNCKVIRIMRKIQNLSTIGRPLSKDADSLQKLCNERENYYSAISDYTVSNDDDINCTLNAILNNIGDK